tara:strand:+ start:3180 stop:4202 length:1023 start_codon:yes stop_codon:yes gene_type:complete
MKNIGLFFFFFLAISCSSSIPLHSIDEEIPKPAPEYNKIEHWIAHPNKFDASDLLPLNVINDTLCLDSIDVFFVYPTIYNKGDQWNADINDKELNLEIEKLALNNQANVFCGLANIYSPLYRQMHIHGYKDNANGIKAFDIAYKDIENAFKYYLHNFNNGNQIVLAAHSQGTHHLQKLFTDFLLENDTILKKIKLAYLIGDRSIQAFSIQDYPHCEKPKELNCFLSWNTYKSGISPTNYSGEKIPVSNPISWLNNGDASLYNEHKGILINDFKFIKNESQIMHQKMLSAEVHNGLLWVDIERFRYLNLYDKLLKGDYHILDYNLFWMNIRHNFYQRMSSN